MAGQNVKLLMQWDIKPGRDQEYFEFVVREWVPGITKLGVEPTGAWFTIYSRTDAAQIVTEGIAQDLDTMRRILRSVEWLQLHGKLQDYVTNYRQKVVRLRPDFQF